MSDHDLTKLLRTWPNEAGRINARRIEGEDGNEKIQVRLDLGVLQMEVNGRPDGLKVDDYESLLDLQLARLSAYADASGTSTGFTIAQGDCKSLREEAVQYYHRYVAMFALGDHDRVVRDTTRNLALFDLCRDFAAEESDRGVLEQFRPQVIMMRTRAEAERALVERDPSAALAAIDHGIEEIERCLAPALDHEAIEATGEMQLLRGMRDALVPKLPASQRVELEERLRAALDAENYELAAILRDELRLL